MIRELHEEQAVINTRLTRLEKAQFLKDTGQLKKRVLLHETLADLFDEFELKVFMAELKLDYESLDGDNKKEKALSLVLYMQRHGRHAELLNLAQENRPHYDWTTFKHHTGA